MATITINDIPDFDYNGRDYKVTYNIALDEGETLNDITITSSERWCNVKNRTIKPYQVEIELSSNQTLTARTATLSFTFETTVSTYTATATVTQEGFIFYPIWKTRMVKIETETNSVKYHITHNGTTIYSGRAYVMQGNNFVEIDIANICANYLNSSLENAINAPLNFNLTNGVGKFNLYINNNFHSGYLFYNSYTYKENPPYIVDGEDYYIKLSNPIRKEFDSRQLVIYSFFKALPNSTSNMYFYFHKNQTTHYNFGGQVNPQQMYTTLTIVPEGFDTVQFFDEFIPIINSCAKYCLYYQNALGGWDSFLINGNDKQTDKITSHKFVKSIDNTTKNFATKNYLNVIAPTYKLYTDWLTDEEASKMFNLLESTEVYLHNLEDDTIQPINLTNSTCEYKTFKNNGKKKFYYTIDAELAQPRFRQ